MLGQFAVFTQQQAGRLVELRAAIAVDDPLREDIEQLLGVVSLRVEQTRRLDEELTKAMRAGESRPWPDFETARSILVAAMTSWADELFKIGQLLNRWRADASTSLAARAFAAGQQAEYEAWSQELAGALAIDRPASWRCRSRSLLARANSLRDRTRPARAVSSSAS